MAANVIDKIMDRLSSPPKIPLMNKFEGSQGLLGNSSGCRTSTPDLNREDGCFSLEEHVDYYLDKLHSSMNIPPMSSCKRSLFPSSPASSTRGSPLRGHVDTFHERLYSHLNMHSFKRNLFPSSPASSTRIYFTDLQEVLECYGKPKVPCVSSALSLGENGDRSPMKMVQEQIKTPQKSGSPSKSGIRMNLNEVLYASSFSLGTSSDGESDPVTEPQSRRLWTELKKNSDFAMVRDWLKDVNELKKCSKNCMCADCFCDDSCVQGDWESLSDTNSGSDVSMSTNSSVEATTGVKFIKSGVIHSGTIPAEENAQKVLKQPTLSLNPKKENKVKNGSLDEQMINRKSKRVQRRSKNYRRRQKRKGNVATKSKDVDSLKKPKPEELIEDIASSESSLSPELGEGNDECDFICDIVDDASSVQFGVSSFFIAVDDSTCDEDSDWDTADGNWTAPDDFEFSGLFVANFSTPAVSLAVQIASSPPSAEMQKMNLLLRTVNKKWEEDTKDVDARPKKATKISFAPDDALVVTFPVEMYDRKGEWEIYARERCRFQRRIADMEAVISPCLSPQHRAKVLQRLQ